MARLEITFLTTGNRSREGGTMPVPHGSAMTTEVLTIGATSATSLSSSNEIQGTGFVRLFSDADVWIVVGPAPTAVIPAPGEAKPGMRIAANTPIDLALNAGDRIAGRTI